MERSVKLQLNWALSWRRTLHVRIFLARYTDIVVRMYLVDEKKKERFRISEFTTCKLYKTLHFV